MSNEPDRLALLSRALDQTAKLIAGTGPGQAELPTPCASWGVGALVGHVVSDLGNFATAVRGGRPDFGRRPEPLGDDWVAAFATGRDQLDLAWRTADLESPVPTMGGGEAPLVSRADQQIAEFAVHGWDIARATDQDGDLDSAVAEHGLQWARQNLRPEFRGPEDQDKAFGDEVAVADDAPVYDRLAGWFGRDPTWPGEAG